MDNRSSDPLIISTIILFLRKPKWLYIPYDNGDTMRKKESLGGEIKMTTEIKLGENRNNESDIIKNIKTMFGISGDKKVITNISLTQGSIKYALNKYFDMDISSQQLNGKLHGKYGYRDYVKNFDNGKTKKFSDDDDKKFRPQCYIRAIKTNSSAYPLWEINPDCIEVEEAIEEKGESKISNSKEFEDYLKEITQ